MSIKINSLDGVTLKTQGKYVTEDLSVGLLEKDKSAIRSGKFLEDVKILGHKGTIQTFNEDDFEDGAKGTTISVENETLVITSPNASVENEMLYLGGAE